MYELQINSETLQLRNPLPKDTYIPEHAAFPLYSPSFILDVPKGNMPDLNTPEYLDTIHQTFAEIVARLITSSSISS
jgi:histone deacetylase 8